MHERNHFAIQPSNPKISSTCYKEVFTVRAVSSKVLEIL